MRTNWADEPMTRGSYIRFAPGQLTRFASLLTLEEEGDAPRATSAGPLYLAGEWLSDAYPGYMNGAAQTGRIAADAVLKSLRVPAWPAQPSTDLRTRRTSSHTAMTTSGSRAAAITSWRSHG